MRFGTFKAAPVARSGFLVVRITLVISSFAIIRKNLQCDGKEPITIGVKGAVLVL